MYSRPLWLVPIPVFIWDSHSNRHHTIRNPCTEWTPLSLQFSYLFKNCPQTGTCPAAAPFPQPPEPTTEPYLRDTCDERRGHQRPTGARWCMPSWNNIPNVWPGQGHRTDGTTTTSHLEQYDRHFGSHLIHNSSLPASFAGDEKWYYLTILFVSKPIICAYSAESCWVVTMRTTWEQRLQNTVARIHTKL